MKGESGFGHSRLCPSHNTSANVMPNLQLQYQLDPKGTSPDNLITGEKHLISNHKGFAVVAPQKGLFHVGSVRVMDTATSEPLQVGVDVVFLEMYQSLTLKYGTEVAGLIFLKNLPDTIDEVTIEYQVLGGVYFQRSNVAADMLNTHGQKSLDLPQWEDYITPSSIMPNPAVHSLGNDFGFEYIVYGLEKLRNTMVWADTTLLHSLIDKINKWLLNLTLLLTKHMEEEFDEFIRRYKEKLDKAYVKLDKVVNLQTASAAEARSYAFESFDFINPADNKYFANHALAAYKEVFYEYLVASQLTGIGAMQGILMTPLLINLLTAQNGAVYFIDSITNTKLVNLPMNLEFFPDSTDSDATWIYKKITNDLGNRSGIILAVNIHKATAWTGVLTYLDETTTTITWNKKLTTSDVNEYMDLLTKHIQADKDPHETMKHHVGLSEVENLPVVTREDILCRKPIRKYVTYDALLLFVKAYMNNIKTLGDEEDPETEIQLAERYRMIFAPCGPCGTEQPSPPSKPKEPMVEIDPRDKKYAQWCSKYDLWGRFADGFGGSYEKLIETKHDECGWKNVPDIPARGAKIGEYCDGNTLYHKFSDGKGSWYVEPFEANSRACDGKPMAPQLVPIKNAENQVMAFGYDPTLTSPDPELTLMLVDAHNNEVAWIYKERGYTRYGDVVNVPITNSKHFTLGYGIDP